MNTLRPSNLLDGSPDAKQLIDMLDTFVDKYGWDGLGELTGQLQTIRRAAGKDKEFQD